MPPIGTDVAHTVNNALFAENEWLIKNKFENIQCF
jgi:hypothetical protein